MAATTSLLDLVTPTQGTLSGTWGNTVNNGITEYTDIAIAGTLTLTGDGAVTLDNTIGDASATNIVSTLSGAGTVTAQFAIVKISGTTTAKTVTGPSSSKTYIVDNTGSYTVTFKASGQAGVSIVASEKCTVYFNGTDYVKVASSVGGVTSFQTSLSGLTPSTSTTGGITLAGTLGVGSGGTGLTTTTAYSVVFTGTTSTGAFQASAGPGTSGYVLTSNGAGALPTFQASSGVTTGKSIAMAMIFGF